MYIYFNDIHLGNTDLKSKIIEEKNKLRKCLLSALLRDYKSLMLSYNKDDVSKYQKID